jgi:C4-dicarboxylate-specific signal transduction histidine kinase
MQETLRCKRAEDELIEHQNKLEELVEERTKELQKTKNNLEADIVKREKAEEELKENVKVLENWQSLTVDREKKMIELKNEIKKLKQSLPKKET